MAIQPVDLFVEPIRRFEDFGSDREQPSLALGDPPLREQAVEHVIEEWGTKTPERLLELPTRHAVAWSPVERPGQSNLKLEEGLKFTGPTARPTFVHRKIRPVGQVTEQRIVLHQPVRQWGAEPCAARAGEKSAPPNAPGFLIVWHCAARGVGNPVEVNQDPHQAPVVGPGERAPLT